MARTKERVQRENILRCFSQDTSLNTSRDREGHICDGDQAFSILPGPHLTRELPPSSIHTIKNLHMTPGHIFNRAQPRPIPLWKSPDSSVDAQEFRFFKCSGTSIQTRRSRQKSRRESPGWLPYPEHNENNLRRIYRWRLHVISCYSYKWLLVHYLTLMFIITSLKCSLWLAWNVQKAIRYDKCLIILTYVYLFVLKLKDINLL